MTLEIILTVCWILSSLTEGKRDGYFFHNKMSSTDPDKQNIHWLFTLERFIIWALIVKLYSIHNSLLFSGVFGFSLVLIFSFIHNGMYFLTRNKLNKNIYPKRWWAHSMTSESLIELNVVSRTFMAGIGLIGIITSLII